MSRVPTYYSVMGAVRSCNPNEVIGQGNVKFTVQEPSEPAMPAARGPRQSSMYTSVGQQAPTSIIPTENPTAYSATGASRNMAAKNFFADAKRADAQRFFF